MIIREAPIDSHWYRASCGWFISFFITICVAFPAFDGMGHDISVLWPMVWCGLGGAVLFFLIGKFRPKTPRRVLEFMVVFGAFGLLPILISMTLIGLSYFILTPQADGPIWTIRISVGVIAAVWTWREFAGFHARLVERRFMENEFHIEADRITLSRTPHTDIKRPKLSDRSVLGKLFNRVGPFLVTLAPMGYPLQRLLSDSGGVQAVLLFMSILLIPLSIHTLSQMICGAYLWVFKVWQLERRHGKPVVFADPT